MHQTIDIPSLFKSIAQKVNLHFSTRVVKPFQVSFDYGHYDAVNKNLLNKEGSITLKNAKYPLIWMITPFEQKTDRRQDHYCELSGLDFLILTNTSMEESIETRVEKYFKPVLWPVIERFKSEISDSGLFQVLSVDAIPYDYQKDWHYQSGLSGKGNLFNDYIDAVQIKGIRLKVNELVPEGFHFK